MHIELSVSGQRLRREIGPGVVGGSRYYLTAHVAFAGHDWDGCQVWLRIDKDGAQNTYLLDADGCVTADRGINLPFGQYTMSLMGMRDNVRITTNVVPLCVLQSGADGGDPLPEIPQTAAEQIALLAQEAVDTARSVREDADAGDFNGAPGNNGVSAEHKWDGSVLTITSASGTSSADLRGPQGPEGKQGPQGVQGQAGKDAPQDAVRYGVQALTDEEQETARGNIGAASAEELSAETRRAKEAEDNRIKKFYTSNLGETSIADSDDGSIRDLVIGGRCEQRTTKGINLYHYENIGIKKEKNGITFTSVENDGISIVGTSTDNVNSSGVITPYLKNLVNGKAYVCKTFDDDVSTYFVLYMKDGTVLYPNKINFDSETMDKVYPYFGVGMGITIDTVIYPMVCEEELSSNPYEPYTGGAPSPSPDYPQEIKCVEGCTMTVSSADGSKTQEAAIPVTLRSIGDVRDELYVFSDGTGKLVQRIRHRALTNDDIFLRSGLSTDETSNFSVKTLLDLKPQSRECNILCNAFSRGRNQHFNVKNTVFSGGSNSDYIYFCVSADLAYTSEEFAKFVAQQHIEVFYEIRQEEMPLTAEQVKSLFDLRTYYGGTNITYASDNGVEPVVNFDYACAIENFVEYIKAQQGDTRGMIYDMDDRLTQAEVTALEAAIDAQIAQAMMEV